MAVVEKATGLLRELQLKNIEMLKQIDAFCEGNKIQYSLIAGSVIGAVVHGGIIPWDDDIDIAMNRANFEKFRALAIVKLPGNLEYKDFFLDPSQHVLLGRIIDKSTTCVSKDQYGRIRIGGVYIDITVFDVVPQSLFQRKAQYFRSVFALLLVNNKAPENHGTIIRALCSLVLGIYKDDKRIKKVLSLEKQLKKYQRTDKSYTSEMIYFRGNKILYDGDMFDNYVRLAFEDMVVPVVEKYDDYLRKRYSRDYTIIPDPEERKTHRDIQYLDFSKSYVEYINEGKGFAAKDFECDC